VVEGRSRGMSEPELGGMGLLSEVFERTCEKIFVRFFFGLSPRKGSVTSFWAEQKILLEVFQPSGSVL
jgi:hypothetical protein